jgi:hypothetical protein
MEDGRWKNGKAESDHPSRNTRKGFLQRGNQGNKEGRECVLGGTFSTVFSRRMGNLTGGNGI